MMRTATLWTRPADSRAGLPPQEGAQLIAHQTVQHTAGLLGVEEIFVDGAGVGHALLHALLGDLIEGHAVGSWGSRPRMLADAS